MDAIANPPTQSASGPDLAALDAELTRLHGRMDQAERLSTLHEAAAGAFGGDPGARRFQLTHAWIYALVHGDDARATRLEAELVALGGL